MKTDFFEYFKISLTNGKYSHSYLIDSNKVDMFFDDLISFLKKEQYLKSLNLDNNTNLKIIYPNEKNVITIDRVNGLISDFKYINNQYLSFYIIVGSDKMNNSSMNKILKFLEEPNNNVIGFFITSNSSKMIDTIVSRTQTFSVSYKSDKELNLDGQIFLDIINKSDVDKEIKIREKYKNDRVNLKNVLEDLLNNNKFDNHQTMLVLIHTLLLIEANVNILLILDYFFIEMRNINENI